MWQKLLTRFEFLGSTRFWKLVIGGVAYGFFQAGVIDAALFGTIETIVLGSVAVRTVDRFGERVSGK